MKKAFSISANHATSIPSHHIFFDTETYCTRRGRNNETQEQRFRLGCASYVRLEKGKVTRRTEIDFDDVESFWSYVEGQQAKRRILWVWAHNLGFDLTIAGFWEQCEKRRFILDRASPKQSQSRGGPLKGFTGFRCTSGRPTFIRALGEFGIVQFCDLGNYLPHSLAEIGRTIGVPKMEFPGLQASDEQLIPYCRNDVIVLETAVIKLLLQWEKEDCGNWEFTAGKLAFNSWRHLAKRKANGYMHYEVTPIRDDAPDALERESYRGGWTECFYRGKVLDNAQRMLKSMTHSIKAAYESERGPLYVLDYRSLYPSVMRSNSFPVYRSHCWQSASLDRFRAYSDGSNAIARVFLDTPDEPFPIKLRGSLYYAVGRYWTTLGGPELKRAIAHGLVREIAECNLYEMQPIFRPFVDYWWNRRLTAERAGDVFDGTFAKMVLNSLSGKFGQHGGGWKPCDGQLSVLDWGHWTAQVERDGPIRKFRGIAGCTEIWEERSTPEWGFPAISSIITAHGREKVLSLIRSLPPRSVFHVATDAVVVSQDAYDTLLKRRLVDSERLGKLALKGVFEDGEFWGQNSHRLGNTWTQSGSWGKAKETEPGQWSYDAWQQLGSILNSRPDGSVLVHTLPLEESASIHKGHHQPDGWSRIYRIEQNIGTFKPLVTDRDIWDVEHSQWKVFDDGSGALLSQESLFADVDASSLPGQG